MKTTKDRWALLALFCLAIVAAAQLLLPSFLRADVPACSTGCSCKEVSGYTVITGGGPGAVSPTVWWSYDAMGGGTLAQNAISPINTTGGCQSGSPTASVLPIKPASCTGCDIICSVTIDSVNNKFPIELTLPPVLLGPPGPGTQFQQLCVPGTGGGTP